MRSSTAPKPEKLCSDCGRPMVQRKSARGPFWGCSGFPECRKTVNIGPERPAASIRRNPAAISFASKPRTTTLVSGTPEQEHIWNVLADPDRQEHICVDAGPGSGKSYSLINGVLRLPETLNIGVVAFNVHIKNEFNAKLEANGIRNASCVTFNSMGNSALRRVYPNARLEPGKLLDIADELLEREPQFRDIELRRRSKSRYGKSAYVDPIVELRNEVRSVMIKLVRLSRAFLLPVEDPQSLEWLIEQYAIDIAEDGMAIARRLTPDLALAAYDQRHGIVDYDDQIWIPVIENIAPAQFDVLMIDETQDVSRANLQLALMACPSGRFLIVGDFRQAIYSFRGCDSDAIKRIVSHLETTERGCVTLPLTVTWRCAKSHVKLAKGLYNHIQAREDAPEGIIRERVPLQQAAAEMSGGDMVMCRVNKELIPVAYQLLRRGVKAIIRGKDVSDQILTMIRKFEADDVADLLSKVKDYLAKESIKLVALGRRGESRLEALNDKCETLIELCDGMTTIDELTQRIEILFQEFTPEGKPNNAVVLGSVHSCKGLEGNRVYILAPELMPHPKATSEREYEQELHICWVAATRAKFDAEHPGELVFVKGRDRLSTGAIPAVYNWNYERAELTHSSDCRDAWWTRGAACSCGVVSAEPNKTEPLSFEEALWEGKPPDGWVADPSRKAKTTHMLCSDDREGGEHLEVSTTDEQLRALGIYSISSDYDDNLPTWQGPTAAINEAYRQFGALLETVVNEWSSEIDQFIVTSEETLNDLSEGDPLIEPAPFAPIDDEPTPIMRHLAQIEAEAEAEDNYNMEISSL